MTSCKNSDTVSSPKKEIKPFSQLPQNRTEQISKPTVVMISIDGFKAQYMDQLKPPTLQSWAKQGVRSQGLKPSFPTLTFPNHITLITGLRPGHHGIVSNKFYDKNRKEYYAIGNSISVNDGSWYRGVPLWTAAENEGMLSATAFWVGSEAKIGGVGPTYLKPYDGSISNEQRVKWVIDWLSLPEINRPHYIALYFSDVDTAGHTFGPQSNQVKQAVLDIDTQLGQLKKFIEDQKMDVQIVVVSDHGMKEIDNTVDLSSVSSLKGFQTSGKGAVVSFYSTDSDKINVAYDEIKKIPGSFDVYKSNEIPAKWSLVDQDRRGDILVVGKPGTYISFQEGFLPNQLIPDQARRSTHGWDADETHDMDGLFIASGSMFKKNLIIPVFDNVHVYPLITQILQLHPKIQIDGDVKVLEPILVSK